VETSDTDHGYLHYFLMYGVGKMGIPPPIPMIPPKDTHDGPPVWVQTLREIGYSGPVDNITFQKYYDIWNDHVQPQHLQDKMKEIAADGS